MKKLLIESCHENGYEFYRIPGTVIASNGNILVYYECRYGNDWGVSDIAYKISHDGGNTFSERRIIVSGEGYNLVHSPMMIVNGDKIHFLYMKNYCECYYKVSVDGGESFSTSTRLYVLDEFRPEYLWSVAALGPGHGITLKNGRMLIGLWMAHNMTDRTKHRPSKIATIYSDDDGITWNRGEIINTELVNPSENVLAELNNMVIMNIRCENIYRRRIQTESPTGIGSWSKEEYVDDLPDPVCAAGLTQNGNVLYFVNCNTEGFDDKDKLSQLLKDSRINLSLKRYKDNHWELLTKIDDFGGYSDVYASSNKLVCIYEGGRKMEANHWSGFDGLYFVSLDEFL